MKKILLTLIFLLGLVACDDKIKPNGTENKAEYEKDNFNRTNSFLNLWL